MESTILVSVFWFGLRVAGLGVVPSWDMTCKKQSLLGLVNKNGGGGKWHTIKKLSEHSFAGLSLSQGYKTRHKGFKPWAPSMGP